MGLGMGLGMGMGMDVGTGTTDSACLVLHIKYHIRTSTVACIVDHMDQTNLPRLNCTLLYRPFSLSSLSSFPLQTSSYQYILYKHTEPHTLKQDLTVATTHIHI